MRQCSTSRQGIKRSSEDRGDWLSSIIDTFGSWCRKDRSADDDHGRRDSDGDYGRRRQSFDDRIEGGMSRKSEVIQEPEQAEQAGVLFRDLERTETQDKVEMKHMGDRKVVPKGVNYLKQVYDSRMAINPNLQNFKHKALRELPNPQAQRASPSKIGFQIHKEFDLKDDQIPKNRLSQQSEQSNTYQQDNNKDRQFYFDPRRDTFNNLAPMLSGYATLGR